MISVIEVSIDEALLVFRSADIRDSRNHNDVRTSNLCVYAMFGNTIHGLAKYALTASKKYAWVFQGNSQIKTENSWKVPTHREVCLEESDPV